MKLVIQIAIFENSLTLQIREQEDIRPPLTRSSLIFKSTKSHGFRIRRSSSIESSESYLYLRGTSSSNSADKYLTTQRKYDSNTPRNAWLTRLKETLFEYANQENAIYKVNDLGHTQIITLTS